MTAPRLRLGVNIDHVATIRNARGGRHPDPVRAAKLAIAAGCDGITAHLREDRRHIQDRDVYGLRKAIKTRLNFEMANSAEIIGIALKLKPEIVCLVPERRATSRCFLGARIFTKEGIPGENGENRSPGISGKRRETP